ncbi:uncharacterized protein LOC130763138 isoform X2 [Actinidia eriantha]|uniref:uncharacterized protein LOC130763138 isoform X2 n=1 Tax=Actinidia eriantha TaxID=165200 RepID=UPI00258FB7ED|nr:uncharacterized protein LOC130763138 isoform X2 [Actinidia eriantha]
MSSLAGGAGRLFSTCTSFQFPRNHCLLFPREISSMRRRTQTPTPTILVVASVLRSPPPVSELAEDDILQTFLKERESSGDIIAKVSDMLWLGKIIRLGDAEVDVTQQSKETTEDENEAGFLKLTRTREWVAGENSAPVNKKMIAKIKREMMLLTMGIGTLCSGYCLVVFSVQAAVSYATGVLFSCLYIQLLYKHADNLSRETVPQVFRQKKLKKIGIRSEDLKDQFEKFIQGSGIALSSPRLAIPAAIYGVWGLSQHFASDLFDFQLVPAMFGMFAYKAAALVQVYRDNEDLQLIFPENED